MRQINNVDTLPMRSIFILKPSSNIRITMQEHRADWYHIDLEDGVPLERKAGVRKWLTEQFRNNSFDGFRMAIRINKLEERNELEQDISILHPSIHAIILPKISSPADIAEFEQLLTPIEEQLGLAPGYFRFIPVIETPGGAFNALEIANTSARNIALIFGHVDFAVETHGQYENWETYLTARQLVVMAARSTGLEPIDSPYMHIDRPNGFIYNCQRTKALGFGGKIIIYPKQLALANHLFGSSLADIKWAEDTLGVLQDGRAIYSHPHQGRIFKGIPHKEMAKRILNKVSSPLQGSADTFIQGQLSQGGLSAQINVDSVTWSSYDLTIREPLIHQWNASFFNTNRLTRNKVMAQNIGLSEAIVPYILVMTLCGGMSIPQLSESAVVHIGFENAVYLQPVFAGDTLRSYFFIEKIRPTSNGHYSMIDSVHVLINQHDEQAFRFTKRTLFPYIDAAPEPSMVDKAQALMTAPTTLLDRIVHQPIECLKYPHSEPAPLSKDMLLIHRITKVFESSEARMLSIALCLTNLNHYDTQSLTHEDLVVPGPFVLAASLAAPFQDLGDILYEKIEHCSNINMVNYGDSLGSLSYILDVQPLEDNPDLEEVTVKTLGIKNLDMQLLVNQPIPKALFTPEQMKPSDYEAICVTSFPELHHRIVCQTVRKIIRARCVCVDFKFSGS